GREGGWVWGVRGGIRRRRGVAPTVLPMSDEPVATWITTASGRHGFQEYLVRDGAREEITGIELEGIDRALPAPGVLDAIAAAETIVIAPSSPVVSIGTILAVPGVRAALAARRGARVGGGPARRPPPPGGPARPLPPR